MRLSDYEPFVGRGTIEELEILADKVRPRIIQNVNSTYTGGGVAELLARLVPLLSELGIDVRWDVFQGDPRFFEVTKRFHNALHGGRERLTEEDFALYRETTERQRRALSLVGDVVLIHDPQPLGLVASRHDRPAHWVWRCHIDLSNPDPSVWEFLRPMVEGYDAAVFSAPQFARGLPIRQFQIAPSIDPLSDKNKELSPEFIGSVLASHGIPQDHPIITQISRFDHLKDPLGLIEAWRRVRRSFDCRLVLAGGTADDDPEGAAVLAAVLDRARADTDIHVLLLPPRADLEVNALQRASTIVVQKSIREGFALTVSEALWKEKPVVASAVGGIPLQVKDGITGLLSYGVEGTAYNLRQLLANPGYARQLGRNGREHVRQNFLITRDVRDHLLLVLALTHRGDLIHLEEGEGAEIGLGM